MTPLLRRVLDLHAVPTDGMDFAVRAAPDERAAIAAYLGLLDLSSLTADLVLKRSGRGRIAVTGRVRADLVQACVVTLEPVPQVVDEALSRRFAPEKDAEHGAQAAEIEVAVDESDPPESYGKEGIDLGAVVLEHLILGLDPYPRAPGAALPEAVAEPEDKPQSPFAILKTIGHSDRA